MPAVTVARRRSAVFGNRRVVLAKMNMVNADTFATDLHLVESWRATSTAANAIGGTIAAGVITFATGGAENNVLFEAVGY